MFKRTSNYSVNLSLKKESSQNYHALFIQNKLHFNIILLSVPGYLKCIISYTFSSYNARIS